jgi:hypothetical protein
MIKIFARVILAFSALFLVAGCAGPQMLPDGTLWVTKTSGNSLDASGTISAQYERVGTKADGTPEWKQKGDRFVRLGDTVGGKAAVAIVGGAGAAAIQGHYVVKAAKTVAEATCTEGCGTTIINAPQSVAGASAGASSGSTANVNGDTGGCTTCGGLPRH